MGGHYK
jgi:hypothetical protein